MKYLQEHREYLFNNQQMGRAELTEAFNTKFGVTQSFSSINSFCKKFGLKSERDTRFKPGNKSWNEGTKGLTGANLKSFKAGHRPHNWKPVGHQRIDKDGYIMVKVKEPNTFRLKHRYLWEKYNGPLEKGEILTFIDGDKANCVLSNLEKVTRQEQVRRNKMKINSYPSELQPTIKLIAKVQAGASKIKDPN